MKTSLEQNFANIYAAIELLKLQIKALNGSEMSSTSKCQSSCEFESKTPDTDLNSPFAIVKMAESQIVDGNEPRFVLNDSNL